MRLPTFAPAESIFRAALRRLIVFVVALCLFQAGFARAGELRVTKTARGTHFGVFAEKPAKPAPTLCIIGNPMTMIQQGSVNYQLATGEIMAKHGWIYVVLDPAGEGYDLKEGQPSSLPGWAIRARKGEDFIGPYVRNCADVLDHLVAEGFTDPQRVAVQGISRGGFCAMHFAAREPRIQAVLGMSPVTNPLALREFKEVTEAEVAGIRLDGVMENLVGRTLWITIGNSDDRVSTDDCIALTRRLVSATRRLQPQLQLIPVHLQIGMSAGHRTPDDGYSSAAEFLLARFPKPQP